MVGVYSAETVSPETAEAAEACEASSESASEDEVLLSDEVPVSEAESVCEASVCEAAVDEPDVSELFPEQAANEHIIKAAINTANVFS